MLILKETSDTLYQNSVYLMSCFHVFSFCEDVQKRRHVRIGIRWLILMPPGVRLNSNLNLSLGMKSMKCSSSKAVWLIKLPHSLHLMAQDWISISWFSHGVGCFEGILCLSFTRYYYFSILSCIQLIDISHVQLHRSNVSCYILYLSIFTYIKLQSQGIFSVVFQLLFY